MYAVVGAMVRGARNTGILLAAALLAWVTMTLALLLADIGYAVSGQGGGSVAIVAFFTLPIWLLGLPTIGGLVWIAGARLVSPNARNAMIIGGGVAALFATIILHGLIPAFDPGALVTKAILSLSAAAGGAVAGWVIWELAYRRAARPA